MVIDSFRREADPVRIGFFSGWKPVDKNQGKEKIVEAQTAI